MASVSSLLWQTMPIFLTFLSASLDTSLAKSVIASSYAQHCDSIAPESSPTKLRATVSNPFLISEGSFSARNSINKHLFSSSGKETSMHDNGGFFDFQLRQVHHTNDEGTLMLEGTLVLLGSWAPIRDHGKTVWITRYGGRSRVVFKLSGFWSEAKGKLCMVGTGEIHEPQEDDQIASAFSAVLKLDYPKVSNITTSIIKGSINSLDKNTSSAYFEPIQLVAYAQRRYEYTLAKQVEESCSHFPKEEHVESDGTSICSHLLNQMRYETFTSSDLIKFLGFRFLSTSQFVCSEDGKVHLSMILSNKIPGWSSKPLLLRKLLVAEGNWDHQNSRLCLLACDLTGKKNNCFLGITFWFPATFSLKQRSTMVGRMWNTSNTSNKGANAIISVYGISHYSSIEFSDLNYEYTELDNARKHCKIRNFDPKLTRRYPDAQSQMDMRLQFSMHGTHDKSLWGRAEKISTNDIYHGSRYGGTINNYSMTSASSSTLVIENHTDWNVGYKITYTVRDKNNSDWVDISAEGIYNSVTGTLCLFGCRRPTFSHTIDGEILNSSLRIDDNNLDCTFFIQLQLPSLDSRNKEGGGKISSTRAKSDPLYFEPFEVKVSLMGTAYSTQEYDRMDAEMIMVIISRTILCICLYLQLRHVTKYNTYQSLMSITMIAVITLGCMVSLILNVETMLIPSRKQQFFMQSGGWTDTTNAIVRLIAIVTLLISYRLLQLAWGSRSKEEKTDVISRSAERKSLMLCVPLYIAGAVVSWFVHLHDTTYYRTILEDLSRYVGLVEDNFLLPQIIFNMFSKSRAKVLNPFFFVGVTLVRVVPHIYDATRSWWHPLKFHGLLRIYGIHDEDYYSTLFNIVVPFEGLLLILLVYLQQRFGGRCFLPKRFKHSEDYERVSASDDI